MPIDSQRSTIKAVLAEIPPLPGVYRFVNAEGVVLYVGKAANLKKRVCSYFQQKRQSPRMKLMLAAIVNVEITVTASENAALLLESNLIKSLRPKYNILFRDDKSYPFLRLTNHPYSRLMFYRGKNSGDCFGPFPDSAAVRETIDMIQRLFRLRTCADAVFANRSRPCLLHGIGRCSAPCVNLISPINYASDTAGARVLLRGDSQGVEADLRTQMEAAAAAEDFERAAILRDRLRALAVMRGRHFVDDRKTPDADYVGAHCAHNECCVNVVMVRGGRHVGERRFFPAQAAAAEEGEVLAAFVDSNYGEHPPPRIVPSHHLASPPALPLVAHCVVAAPRGEQKLRAQQAADNAKHALVMRRSQQMAAVVKTRALGERLSLSPPPRRLECFDISHSMGEEPIAARVVFIDGAPHPAEYRRYKIAPERGGDDYASIHEAVARCYRRTVADHLPLPDLLIIDGGSGQVRAAAAALATIARPHIPLLGMAKGAARKVGEEKLITGDGEVLSLPPDDPALHLLQAVRDEAHRFAVAGHRRRRDKKRQVSVLEDIEGVGPNRRRQLITYFGGLRGLKAAGEDELIKIRGVGAQLARRIYDSLR